MKNLYKYAFANLLTLLFIGCKELDLAPENSFTDLTYWTSEAKAQSV